MSVKSIIMFTSFMPWATFTTGLRIHRMSLGGLGDALLQQNVDPDDYSREGKLGMATCEVQLSEQDEFMTSLVAKLFHDMDNSTETVRHWLRYQDRLSDILRKSHPDKFRATPYRTLIVSAVHDSPVLAEIFDSNMKKLRTNKAKDEFKVALFHLDSSNKVWSKYAWYQDSHGLVVRKEMGSGCKQQFWKTISPSEAAKYDYLWLMDEDIRLDFFNWDFYRAVLSSHEPLVSQPVVLPKEFGERGSDHLELNMKVPKNGSKRMVYAFEMLRSEVQVPLLSSKVWPALHERMSGNDLTSAWKVDTFWDVIAALSRVECGRTGVLAVNAAPVRHMNCRNLWSGTKCTKSFKKNSRPLSDAEDRLIQEALKGISCNVPRNWSKTCGLMKVLSKVHTAIANGDQPLPRCLQGLRSNYTGTHWTEELKLE